MLKSIVELLEELPEPYRTQALLNNDDAAGNLWKIVSDNTIACALSWAFAWSFSPQGSDYWKDVCEKLKNNIPLISYHKYLKSHETEYTRIS